MADIVLHALPAILERDVQLVMLGQGDLRSKPNLPMRRNAIRAVWPSGSAMRSRSPTVFTLAQTCCFTLVGSSRAD